MIQKMNNSKFKTMSFDEMSKTQSGWKLYGKETTSTVHGSIAGNWYGTRTTTTTYVFGIGSSSVFDNPSDGFDSAL